MYVCVCIGMCLSEILQAYYSLFANSETPNQMTYYCEQLEGVCGMVYRKQSSM